MYSKKERKNLTEEFWTALGAYLSPISSADGERINWINYKTGVKGLKFSMKCAERECRIGIECVDRTDVNRQDLFNKLLLLKSALERETGEVWQWQNHHLDESGQTSSLTYTTLQNVSITDRSNWPDMISFFKIRMLALDRFWGQYKIMFEL